MREKFDRNTNNTNIGEIGVPKQDGVNYDKTLEVVKEINREYNRKLLKKLIILYGKDNAISIYDKMRQEGEKELQELFEISQTSDVDESLNGSLKL